ncbi:MAG: DUF5654 family protein [bacterium]
MQLSELKKELRQKILSYITAAFGLVAALAWKDAISAMIEYLFPLSRNNIIAKFIYALVMTLVLVVISVYLLKWLKKDED